ncbi:Fanconi anemia group G protein isoform X2 [Archocentrus centrarchus]|uniref:Fanconi anemia group G protein isoform X2 n=1 Tax=Archocentrus centrarchus TaxID=63155 RepID=UPI0011E9C34B|nr:Fanconi anemia group G protein isoform X2 [Archocentrus centrarchus]
MYQPPSLLEKWIQENNDLVNKCKQESGRDAVSRDHSQTSLRWCSSEFHKLLKKIQGIPAHVDHAQLELAVVCNTCVCFTSQSQFLEAELLLKQTTERVLQMAGDDSSTSDPLVLWRTVLKSVGNTALHLHALYLLCLQWALWLAKCQLETIQEFREELSSLCETLCGGVGDGGRTNPKAKLSNSPLLVMDPKRLTELLQICTSIARGAERLNEGRSSEALSDLQASSALPAPRALMAYTDLLSGSCLTHMNRPQMALQCYRKALETDSRCVCALYQSMLIFRQLGNTPAEIQALRILHSTLMLPPATEPVLAGIHPLSPALLLSSQSLNSLLSVPSALSVLYSLALKCVLSGRVAEGVEHYLDLLGALHSEDQHAVHAEISALPRIPELYLEAGTALLMARRPADCMVLCNEVLSTTLELLPEKVVLEESEEKSGGGVEGEDKVTVLLWAAAAYLLQGHCHTLLKDWKQAVTHYTRCINLLVKVRLKNKDFQPQIPTADMNLKYGRDLCVLQTMKGLSLAGRGISFTQMDHLRQALRDLQLSLQAFSDCAGAGLWCGEVLWRLGRRHEAAACWEKTWSLTAQSSVEKLPMYLQDLQSGPLLDSAELRHRIKELDLT